VILRKKIDHGQKEKLLLLVENFPTLKLERTITMILPCNFHVKLVCLRTPVLYIHVLLWKACLLFINLFNKSEI